MKTTQLTFQTDFDKLNAKYVFFKFTATKNTDENVWQIGGQLDKLLKTHSVIASVYRQDNHAFVMLERSDDFEIEALRLKITDDESLHSISVIQVIASNEKSEKSITGVDLYQLLFNATVNSQGERYQFNHLGGKLVIIPPATKIKPVVTAFHLILTPDLVLVAKATTYQTKVFAKKSEKDKTKLAKKLAKPAYQLHLNTFKRDFDNHDDKAYIQAGVPNKKACEPALNIQSHTDFLQSRLAILQTAVSRFNRLFQGIVACDWSNKTADKTLSERFHLLNTKNAIEKLAKPLDIRLLDKIGTTQSDKLITDIHQQLASLNIFSKVNQREIANACHICLVKPKDDYENSDEKDPYRQDFRYYRQHVTDELYQDFYQTTKAKTLLKNLVKELWIKQSISDNRITLLDNRYALKGTWIFGIIQDKNYHLLELQPNGEYQYFQHDDGLLFQKHPYDNEIRTIQSFNHPYKDNGVSPIELFIISPEKDLNIILNHEECVMPDLSMIEREILAKDEPLPNSLSQTTELVKLFEMDLSIIQDKHWKSFKQAIYVLDEPVSKTHLVDTINKHFHTSSDTNKAIRTLLRQHGVILNFSKAKDDLLNKMTDTFTIQAGTINEDVAWYSVGYYHGSLQDELSHMLHLRKIIALKGNLRHLDLLELMDVDFVRYNNFTVLPYPTKYLREILEKRKSYF